MGFLVNLGFSTKAKEAIKIALALVLVYYIGLRVGWMNPYWAAWAVGMIALSTIGQSLHKGLLRIAGTIPGCLVAMAILGLAPQNGWLFILLACSWLFFATYMMLTDKKRSYFWNVSGFVCLVIVMSGSSDSVNAFEHAVFRTIETIMGVGVYTLVTVFLWPRNNTGAIRKAGRSLMTTQSALVIAGRDFLNGKGTDVSPYALRSQEVQQFGALGQALEAEGSESYEVREVRYLWDGFHQLCSELMVAIDRWGIDLAELPKQSLNTVFPRLPALFDEIDKRFKKIEVSFGDDSSASEVDRFPLEYDGAAIQGLSTSDLAKLAVFKKNLESIEALTRSILECVQNLAGHTSPAQPAASEKPPTKKKGGFALPVLDVEIIKGAGLAAISIFIGFLIYIYVNPPGHASWYEFPGNVAMALAGMQQANSLKLGKSLGVASVLALAAYVFIMPALSTFFGLGILIFLMAFITCYFFTGLARMMGIIAIINEISIQNQQSYDFAAMANGLLFTVMVFVYLYALMYLLSSSRPEKALLKLVKRYFRSVDYLEHAQASPGSGNTSWLQKRKFNFHRYEINTLPAKIAGWGKFIDHKLFPANTPEQIKTLVTNLEMLSIRIESLLETGEGTIGDLRGHLAKATQGSEAYYRLMGGLRGFDEASAAYAGVAKGINWAQWREERFS